MREINAVLFIMSSFFYFKRHGIDCLVFGLYSFADLAPFSFTVPDPRQSHRPCSEVLSWSYNCPVHRIWDPYGHHKDPSAFYRRDVLG